jgi:nitrite reductase/ring-hydroxylating ferredoxin subunit
MVFRSASVRQEGEYAVQDADWNYKDVPHLNIVHRSVVRAVIADVTEDHLTSINFQQLFGARLPITLFNYSVTPTTQVYFTTFFLWVLVVETTLEDLGDGRTRVDTTFYVGSSRPFMALFPLISRLLTRNNRLLMQGDIPMRERRGQLRTRGFRFAGDEKGHGFESTMPLWPTHVIAPPSEPTTLVIDDVVERTRVCPYLAGTDDHLGVRVEQSRGQLLVLPRICMHEGACLDQSPCENGGNLRCPWHGKRIEPLASFPLTSASQQQSSGAGFTMLLDDTTLTITFLPSS